MAEQNKEQNNFYSSQHGLLQSQRIQSADKEYFDYRCSQFEKALERHDKELTNIRDKQTDVVREINQRIDDLRLELNTKIDDIRDTLAMKIEENRTYNSRWFIGILATLLTSIVLFILTNSSLFT